MSLQNVINNKQGVNSDYEGGQYLLVQPANTSTLSAIGTLPVVVGTVSTPAQTTTNNKTATRRTVLTGTAVAGNVVFIRQSSTLAWRGNSAFNGGFNLVWRFGFETLVAGQRFFVGLSDSAANPTNVDPLTSVVVGKIGLAVNTNTGNLQFVTNASGTAPTVTDLGANFTVNTTDVYELILSGSPGNTSIEGKITNKTTGNIIIASVTANIFTATTFFAPIIWMTNNATAAAFAFFSAVFRFTTPN
jgi:hypothetical protein